MQRDEINYVIGQLDLMERIAYRGRLLGVNREDTHLVDMFQHLQDEIDRLRKYIESKTGLDNLPDVV